MPEGCCRQASLAPQAAGLQAALSGQDGMLPPFAWRGPGAGISTLGVITATMTSSRDSFLTAGEAALARGHLLRRLRGRTAPVRQRLGTAETVAALGAHGRPAAW